MKCDSSINLKDTWSIVWLAMFLIASSLMLMGCGSSGGGAAPVPTPQPISTRSFYMGFTPWPYDSTTLAVDDTYLKIQNNGDMVAHHIDSGIPWQAALDSTPYHVNVEGELNGRVSNTQHGKVVYLAISSLNSGRTNIADHWGAGTGEPLPAPWNGYAFNNPDVIDAYVNFSLDLIQRLNPSYFNYGIEISELMINNATAFDDFVAFAAQVYPRIKAVHPTLPLMVSIGLKTPGSAEMVTAQAGFARIRDYVDLVGISTYGYIFYSHTDKGDPANLPSDWLSQINVIAPGKPVAIAETGWIAEDLVIPAFTVSETSDPAKQNAYLQRLFEEADQLDAQFLTWFSVVDFDALWIGALGSSDLAKIWRDTGLYDEALQPREGLLTWQAWQAREKR